MKKITLPQCTFVVLIFGLLPIVLAITLPWNELFSQNPAIDLSFNGNGKRFYSDGSSREAFEDMAVDASGRILLAGYTDYDPDEGGRSRGVVMRLLNNGTLDNSWGTNGIVYIDFPNSTDELYGIALDAAGRVVLCGKSNTSNGALYRLLGSNGSLDASFGTGGRVVLNVAYSFGDVAVLSDGKMVVVGSAPYSSNDDDMLIARFNSNGTPDLSFGSANVNYALAGGDDDEYASRLAVQSDGKIVVAGYQKRCSGDDCNDPIVGRFLADGQYDSGFGIKVIDAAQREATSYDLALQNVNGEERILVSGSHEPSTDNFVGFIVRLRNNGNYDTGFNGSSNGFLSLTNMSGSVITVQNDGKILIASYSGYLQGADFYWNTRLMRRNVDGTLDVGFGNNGIFDHQASGYFDLPFAIRSISNKIYVVGAALPYLYNFSDFDGFISRYTNCSGGPSITTSVVNSKCGQANGQVNLTAIGGATPFTYAWSNGQNTPNLQNLAPGAYSVTVTTADGCSSVASATVSATPVVVASITKNDAKCGLNNGSATVTISSGPGIQSYQWNNGGATASVSNLAPGNYSVTITDVNGCTSALNTSIGSTQLPAFNVNVVHTTCGLNNGALSAIQTSGPSITSYLWSTGQTGVNLSNLAPGTYSVTATDVNSCTLTDNRTVQSSPALTLSVTSTGTTCGLNNGSVCASVSGPIGIQSYSWSNGATTSCIQNLAPGVYSVTATDLNGCTQLSQASVASSVSFAVNLGPDITLQPGQSAVINAETPGAAGYQWSTGALTPSINVNAPGNYSVTVTNTQGCTASDMVTVSMITSTIAPADEGRVKAYPSPVATTLHVDLGSLKPQHLAVFDLSGRMRMEYTVLPEGGIFDIQVSELPAGNYFIRVWIDDQMAPVTRPFIKL